MIDEEEIKRRREIVSRYAARFHKSGDVMGGGSTFFATSTGSLRREEEKKGGAQGIVVRDEATIDEA